MANATLRYRHGAPAAAQGILISNNDYPSTSLPRLRSAQVRASRSGWSGQYSLLDYSYKLSGFSPELLTTLF